MGGSPHRRPHRWWLITPEGNAWFSKGVNHVSLSGDRSPALGYSPYGRAVQTRYGSAAKWTEATAARMRSWGLNTRLELDHLD